jgi:hypothetical protein
MNLQLPNSISQSQGGAHRGTHRQTKNQRRRLDVRRVVDGVDRILHGDHRQRLLTAAASAGLRTTTRASCRSSFLKISQLRL